MRILDAGQFEILHRVRAGKYLGDVSVADLQGEIDLMLALRLIEPTGACPYRLTAIGIQVLTVATAHDCDIKAAPG